MGKLGAVAGGVVVLGAVYAGSGWWLGQKVERVLPAETVKVAERLGARDIKPGAYERGLFESRATSVLTLDVSLPPEPGQEPEIEPGASVQDQLLKGMEAGRKLTLQVHLVQTVKHGPLAGGRPAAAVIETRVDHVDGLDAGMRRALAKAQAPWADTVVGLDGSVHTHAVLPAGEIVPSPAENPVPAGHNAATSHEAGASKPAADVSASAAGAKAGAAAPNEAGDDDAPASTPFAGRLSWQEGVIDVRTAANRRDQDIVMSWPGGTMEVPVGDGPADDDENDDEGTGPGAARQPDDGQGGSTGRMTLTLNGLSAQVKQQLIDPDLWLFAPGRYTMQLDDWSMKLTPPQASGGKDRVIFRLSELQGQGEGTLGGRLFSQVDHAEGKLMVMNTPLDSLVMDSKMASLDVDAMRPVQDLLQALGRTDDPRKVLPDEAHTRTLLQGVAAASPDVKFDLAAAASSESATLGMSARMTPMRTGPQQRPLVADLMQSLTARATVTLPKAWVDRMQERFNANNPDMVGHDCDFACTLGRTPVFQYTGNAWTLDASLSGSGVYLNGQRLF